MSEHTRNQKRMYRIHKQEEKILEQKLMISSLQQKVEQLEKENEYLKMSNPEQNMEHFRIVNENKRKIDMLRKENHQLENIRKEAIEYIGTDITARALEQLCTNYQLEVSLLFVKIADDLLKILNKGEKK